MAFYPLISRIFIVKSSNYVHRLRYNAAVSLVGLYFSFSIGREALDWAFGSKPKIKSDTTTTWFRAFFNGRSPNGKISADQRLRGFSCEEEESSSTMAL